MDLQRIIAELEAEKSRLDEAIIALERLSASNGKRRDRSVRSARETSAQEEQREHPPASEPESTMSSVASQIESGESS